MCQCKPVWLHGMSSSIVMVSNLWVVEVSNPFLPHLVTKALCPMSSVLVDDSLRLFPELLGGCNTEQVNLKL